MLKVSGRTIPSLLKPSYANVPHRALVAVTGENAAALLHGIISNNIPPAGGIFSSFLHAQGRVMNDVFIYPLRTGTPLGDGFLVEYDPRPSESPPLPSLLKRYVLRSKVKVRDVSKEWDVWAAWGTTEEGFPQRCWHWAASQAIESNWVGTKSPWLGNRDLQIHDRRMDRMGYRELVRTGEHPSFKADHDLTGDTQYMLHRIAHGVPEGSAEIIPMHAFPMESNLDMMGAIDFRKGCYVGQELTVRTYHTGLVRKRIFPVLIHPANESAPTTFTPRNAQLPEVGADIVPVSATEKPLRLRGAGKLLSSCGGLGLALLRMEHLEAVDSGQALLHIRGSSGESFSVQHWWPSAWPDRPADESEGHPTPTGPPS